MLLRRRLLPLVLLAASSLAACAAPLDEDAIAADESAVTSRIPVGVYTLRLGPTGVLDSGPTPRQRFVSKLTVTEGNAYSAVMSLEIASNEINPFFPWMLVPKVSTVKEDWAGKMTFGSRDGKSTVTFAANARGTETFAYRLEGDELSLTSLTDTSGRRTVLRKEAGPPPEPRTADGPLRLTCVARGEDRGNRVDIDLEARSEQNQPTPWFYGNASVTVRPGDEWRWPKVGAHRYMVRLDAERSTARTREYEAYTGRESMRFRFPAEPFFAGSGTFDVDATYDVMGFFGKVPLSLPLRCTHR